MRNLVKISTRRLVVSGDLVELYEYERPFAFNLAPLRLSSGSVSENEDRRTPQGRRNDNLGLVRCQIRRLIECNYAAYGYQPVFLTFTFGENIKSVEVANKRFHDFIKRFTRKVGAPLKYLSIIEFQKRGAVHYHCVFFNLGLDWELSERRTRAIASLWGHGFVDIERIRHARRVAPYVCKYLEKGVHDPRLRGRKAYFTSRALFRPSQFRDESRIDKILQSLSLKQVRVDTYNTLFRGKVKYIQYHVTSDN